MTPKQEKQRAQFLMDLSAELTRTLLNAVKGQDAALYLSPIDSVLACGAAVKALAVMASQIQPNLTEDDALRELCAAFEAGLAIPSDFIAKVPPQH